MYDGWIRAIVTQIMIHDKQQMDDAFEKLMTGEEEQQHEEQQEQGVGEL